ncbi:MAG TPA: GGDEF domain-containing protein [Acidobacteriaceae bacterium]|nr:GGDEF domain-containing protein [Acidobacteriaceae bacterium]
MHVFATLDGQTLLACDFILSVAFSVVFFAMKRTYPALRGIKTIAISFLLGIPGAFLLASWGRMPRVLTITVAYCFMFASFVFLYRGILRFIGSRRTIALPVTISLISAAVLFYSSQLQENLTVRILAISLTIAMVRGLIALELLRKSPSFNSATTMRLFAASMAFFAAASVECGISAILSGGGHTGLEVKSFSAMLLFLGLVSICVTGLFVLTLSSGELIARSRDESLKDSLSGAFNRRGIEAKLDSELQHVQRNRHRLSVALIDVDYFKAINDIQGHAAGDAALRDVADAISSHLRGRDYLGRYGGDEFLLILPNTPCSIALAVTERLNRAVTNLHLTAGTAPLTLSIGITEAVPHDDSASLLARADKALYQAKSDGRNCRRVFTDAEDKQPTLRQPVFVPATNSSLVQQ